MASGSGSVFSDEHQLVSFRGDDSNSVRSAIDILRDFERAHTPPDSTEPVFEHVDILELPEECRASVLVHGHRVGLVRFAKIKLACQGGSYATPSTPESIDD